MTGDAVAIAAAFHTAYEKLAPKFNYETRPDSAVPWDDVPLANRALMTAVVTTLMQLDVIRPGDNLP
jgi:hypothetical protein